MSRDLRLFLEDIQAACLRVSRYANGLTLEEFLEDERTYDAVIRNLEIIGEAAKHVPHPMREQHPNIEWKKLAGLRDMISHAYFGLDPFTIWTIVQEKVPDLLSRIESILAEDQ